MKIQNKKKCLSIFIILAVIAITNLYASDKVDSTLIKRVLPNGLTYYIKHLPDAGDKVFMRFYVNAGNRVATSGQPDVAHAIEHLAFAATKNFPLGISSYPKLLEESGMEGRGRDMYAFNGQDGTVYHFDTNSYNLKGMELGIRWFQDILGGLSLTSEDIEIERERLIQERYSNNQVRRKHAVIRSEMYAGIFPCNRSKQGYKEKIKNFAEDSLRAYYKDWYQPKNVGIVIVGNIPDVRVLENKIKQGFLKFQNKKNTNELPDCDAIYFSRSNQFKIIERPTEDNIPIVNNKIEINLFYRDSLLRSTRGIESSKRQLLWEITNEVLDKKLQELTHSYTTNFDIGVVNMIKLDNSKPAASSIIIEGDSLHIEGGISEVYTKINELKTYGLSAEEWSKLKKKYLDYLNNNLNERDRGAKVWANNIGENFLYNLPLLNSDQNKRLISWLTQFNTKDINQLIASLINPLPQDIGIIKPKNSD
ncbi:M16 family metallopeptidase [Salegentibacter sp. F14]